MNEMIQALESRRLLTIVLNGSTIEITGDAGDNVVDFSFGFSLSGATVIVEMDGDEEEFEQDDVNKIDLNLRGGNDTVNKSDDFADLPGTGIFKGGSGNDTFNLGDEIPVGVIGGAGADVINATGALSGGGGADEINGGPETDGISGGKGNDTLNGGGKRDYITGGGGDDEINGGGGKDLLAGGTGADNINGGAKLDRIWGMDDDDVINGRAGADIIFGGLGTDNITNGAGDVINQDEDADIEDEIDEIEATIDEILEEFENA